MWWNWICLEWDVKIGYIVYVSLKLCSKWEVIWAIWGGEKGYKIESGIGNTSSFVPLVLTTWHGRHTFGKSNIDVLCCLVSPIVFHRGIELQPRKNKLGTKLWVFGNHDFISWLQDLFHILFIVFFLSSYLFCYLLYELDLLSQVLMCKEGQNAMWYGFDYTDARLHLSPSRAPQTCSGPLQN